MPLDYSKWKAIEVSDDEDDTHPNIDTPSLFRWRHQARLERMAEKKLKKEQLEKEKSSTNNKLKDLEDRLASAKISEEEKVKMQKEIDDLKEQDNKYRAKEAELAAQEKLEPWNVDTIGTEGFSKSRINKVSEPKPAQKLSDEDDGRAMAAFCETNESLLQTYAHLKGLKASEKFLIDHPFLACEYTANYLTIECLNCAIDMKDETMCQMAEQCIVMQYLLELAKSLKAVATNENVIRNFFRKFAAADPSYMKAFHEEVTGFQDRLRKRAQDKRDAAYAEFEQEEKKKRIEQSPGGLDPQEVFEELPEEMQKCFESQDIQGLKDLATKLDEEVFAYHFQRCIDSGLWVPEKPQDESSNNEGETETDDNTFQESVKTEDLFE